MSAASMLGRRACRLLACSPAAPSRAPALARRSRALTTYTWPSSRLAATQWLTRTTHLQRRLASTDTDTIATTMPEEGASMDAASSAPQVDGEAPVTLDGTEVADTVKVPESTPASDLKTSVEATADKTLYIGNLYFEATPDSLREAFEPFGELAKVRIVTDVRGLSRGFAFVEYVDSDSAARAVEQLDQSTFKGRRIVVQIHKPKPKRPNFSSSAPSMTLFIGNMSYEMTDKDLSDMFRDMRNVLDVRVAIDRNTGQNRGFAHADFSDVESAQEAYQKLNGKVIHGRLLRIDYSQPSAVSRKESQ